MRFYIQYKFVCELFAFANVYVMCRHGLKAMLQFPFGQLPLWRLLGLLEVRLQLEGSRPFCFLGKTPPFIKGEYKYIKIKEGSSFSSFGVLGVFGGLRFQDIP